MPQQTYAGLMDSPNYKELIRNMKVSKKLGQNFLVNREIAKTEANFGIGRNVLELGPGFGALTRELCNVAESVIAVERDARLYEYLTSNIKKKNLKLINSDFFDVPSKTFSKSDIMISNIPYNLSSKALAWLGNMQMPAVLCLQKEFVQHMVSEPSSRNYSKLSVMCSLQFSMTYILDVPPDNFFPMPRVSSALVYLKPKNIKIPKESSNVLSSLMIHKKKKIRNALIDSAKLLGIEKGEAAEIAKGMPNNEKRAFQMTPQQILDAAGYVSKALRKK